MFPWMVHLLPQIHLIAPMFAPAFNYIPWKWKAEQQKAFEKLKEVISQETLLTFLGLIYPFMCIQMLVLGN